MKSGPKSTANLEDPKGNMSKYGQCGSPLFQTSRLITDYYSYEYLATIQMLKYGSIWQTKESNSFGMSRWLTGPQERHRQVPPKEGALINFQYIARLLSQSPLKV